MKERFLKYAAEDLTSRLSLFDCGLDMNRDRLDACTVPSTTKDTKGRSKALASCSVYSSRADLGACKASTIMLGKCDSGE